MEKGRRRWKFWGLLLVLMLFTAGFAVRSTAAEVQAASNGFRTVRGKTYYYKNGKKVKGWITLKGKKYYLNRKTGVLKKGWLTSKGRKRYFDPKTGAMKTGLKKISGKYYYFNSKDGWAKSGFVTSKKGTTRYFAPKTYKMVTGWMKNSKKQKWYFGSNGIMRKGLQKIGKYSYYFDYKTGAARTGFIKSSKGYTRYFRRGSYKMATGWLTDSKKRKRYFSSKGVMYTKLKQVGGKYYYFDPSTGLAQKGWKTIEGDKYYFGSSYAAYTGTKRISGLTYKFDSKGRMTYSEADAQEANKPLTPTTPSSQRTIKNFILGALQPVGRTLYMWGGGHDWVDATKKGVSPKWESFYKAQSGRYNYKNYNDLSTVNKAKGLDCSGYVGWSVYQVMQNASGKGSGYTVVSGEIGGYYKSLGFGNVYNQNGLSKSNWTLKAGDIGYDPGHTWIILGQCADKSAVILHSTPNAGVQLSGTSTPSGNYNSQAIALARKYMPRLAKRTVFDYHNKADNYVRRGYYFRWNNTLSDPNGYRNMTADRILADLFK